MRIPQVTKRSGGGQHSHGGTGLYVSQPSLSNWEDFMMDFMIITNQDNPFLGYIDHFFPVIDDTNLPARDDGSKPTWTSGYCLASPTDQSQQQLAPVPENVSKCRSIIIPGTDIGLHDCESVSRNWQGREQTGQTRYMYRAIILNWTTETIQLLDMKEGRWQGLFETLAREKQRLDGDGESLDIYQYNWRLACTALSGAAPYAVETEVTPVNYTHEKANEIWNTSEANERFQACQEAFNPAQTEQQIREAIGATGTQASSGSPTTSGGGSFEDILNQGSDVDAEESIGKQAGTDSDPNIPEQLGG